MHARLNPMARRIGLTAPFISAIACTSRPAGAPSPAPSIAISGVTIIDPAPGGSSRTNQTIVISGQRITHVGDAASVNLPASARRVDARGKFALPGQQALWSATLGPALFFGMERDLGTIEPGRIADILILDADPIADIRNTRRLSAVVQGGRIFDRADLDALLKTVRKEVSRTR